MAIIVRYSRALLKLQCGKLKGGKLGGMVTLLYSSVILAVYVYAAFWPSIPRNPSRGSLLFEHRRCDSLRLALIGTEVKQRRRTRTQNRSLPRRFDARKHKHAFHGGDFRVFWGVGAQNREAGKIGVPWQHASSFECVAGADT